MLFNPQDYKVFFLSYDEPNSEANFAQLLTLCPTAGRVNGVKGSDAAHKEVAKLSTTENVIIVDGDNFVKPEFFSTTFRFNTNIDLSNSVLSYSAYNPLNGNSYGNGGIKVWPVKMLETMKSHESNTDSLTLDFDLSKYLQLNFAGSNTIINDSPLQAWRAGFREGIKLTMENDKPVSSLSEINWRNLDRLYRWMHVGSDMKNGLWAILGARMGAYQTLEQKEVYNINDFSSVDDFFIKVCLPLSNDLLKQSHLIGEYLNIGEVLSDVDSSIFRNIPSILRSPEDFILYKYYPPYDIVFIGDDINYNILTQRFPKAMRASDIKSGALMCTSDYFWVVDNNAIIEDDFNFIYYFDFFSPLTNKEFLAKSRSTGEISNTGALQLVPRMSIIRDETVPIESVTILTNTTL